MERLFEQTLSLEDIIWLNEQGMVFELENGHLTKFYLEA